MIKEVHIEQFGKFEKETFSLAPVTVIYGPNEAGKSTLFTAIRKAVCDWTGIRKTTVLSPQYRFGEGGDVTLLPKDYENTTDPYVFSNLHCIGSDLYTIKSSGSKWLPAVKSKLTGGFDVSPVISELSNRTNTNQTYKFAKHYKKVEDRLKKLKETLASQKEELTEAVNVRNRIDQAGSEIESLQKKLQDLNEKETQLQKEAKSRESFIQLQRIQQMQQKFAAVENLQKDTLPLNGLKDLLKEHHTAAEQADSLQPGITSLESSVETLNGQIRRLEQRESVLKQSLEKISRLVSKAKDTAARIRNLQPRMQTTTTYKKPFLAAGFFLIAAGIGALAASLAVSQNLLFVVAGGILTVAGIAFILFSKQTETYTDTEALSREIRLHIKELNRHIESSQTGDEAIKPVSEDDAVSVNAALAAIVPLINREEIQESELQSVQSSKSQLQQEAETKRDRLDQLKKEKEALFQKLTPLPERFVNLKELEEHLQALVRKKENLEEVKAEIRQAAEANGFKDAGSYKNYLGTQKEELKTEELTESTENELAGIKEQLSAVRRAKEDCRTQLNPLQTVNSESVGSFKEKYGRLPGEIHKTESEIIALEKELEAKDIEIEAADIAVKILSQIKEENESTFKGLARELKSRQSAIFSGENRQIQIQSISEDEVMAEDAAGETRPLQHLSTGTRHSILFALKLLLAEKTGSKTKLLLLDDPFVFFDETRIKGAVEILANFLSTGEEKWQLVLFTKDAFVRDLAQQELNAEVIELQADGSRK